MFTALTTSGFFPCLLILRGTFTANEPYSGLWFGKYTYPKCKENIQKQVDEVTELELTERMIKCSRLLLCIRRIISTPVLKAR
jgi:hypothetical protein